MITRKYSYILLWFLSTILIGTTPVWSNAQSTFNKTFGFQDHREEFSELIQLDENYYFIGGARDEDINNSIVKLVILKTNLEGVFLDSLNYQYDTLYIGGEYNSNNLIVKEGKFLFAGSLRNGTIDSQDGAVFTFDTMLQTSLVEKFLLDSIEVFVSIHQINDNLIVIGQTNSVGNGSYDYYLLKIDENGFVLKDSTYGGTLFEQIGNGVKVNNNQFVFCGRTSSEANPRPYFLNPATNAQFIAVDSNFNELWNTVLYSPGIDRVPMIKEHGFFYSSVEHPILPPPRYLDDYVRLIGQIDLDNGNLLWRDTVKIAEEIIAPKFMETVDSTSFIVFCQVESSDLPYSYAKIIKYNNQGEIVWERSYYEGNHSGCYLNTMIVDDDGFLVFGGTIANLETQSQDAWLLKLRPDGCLSDTDCGLVTGILDLTPGKSVFGVHVYPNPVKDFAHITVEFTANYRQENLALQIYDIEGKLVYQEDQLLEGQIPHYKVDVSNFPKGTYLIQTCIEGKSCGTAKMVVE